MADKVQKKQKDNGSIFQGVLDAVSGSRRKKFDDNENQNSSPYQTMPPQSKGGSVEDKQQGFLDWQVHKISHDLYTRTVYFDTDRISAYQDFRAMDGTPEIAAALNIMRDECLTRGESGDILGIYSENQRVKEVLDDLFRNVLNVEFNLRLWIRDLLKYGDYFVLLNIDKELGIYDFLTLPMEEIHREEGYDGRLDSVRFRWETTGDYFEEWQVAHFRLLEDSRKLPYGRSILDSSRKLWKQLQLAEDAMLVYRIVRAPERRIFFVEVGNLPDQDVKGYMQKMQNQIRKQPMVDMRNPAGNTTMKYDPANVTEDYWVPIRGDKHSRIETLPGATNLGEIQDIEYLQNKLFAALQVPKTYLNYTESMAGGSMLSQADIRFARTIVSIQEAILLELRRIANVHLYFLGFTDDMDNFKLTLTNPSTQQELLKLETMKARLEVFKEMFSSEATSPTSYTWAMEQILGFSKSDIKLILKQKKVEKKLFAEIDAAVETYKKIGLFDELDAIYEDPAAAAAAMAAQGGEDEGADEGGGGGFGGSSALGGGGMGGDPGAEMGDEMGAELGAEPGAELGAEPVVGDEEEELPPELSEDAKKKIKLMKEVWDASDNRSNKLLEALLGEDDYAKKLKDKRKDNALSKSNKKLANTTKKLMRTIDEKLENRKNTIDINPIVKEPADILTEEDNALIKNNVANNLKTTDIFAKLDEITSNDDLVIGEDISTPKDDIVAEGDDSNPAENGK